GESLLMGLNGSTHPIAVAESEPPIAVSSGSACTSATLEPAYVLKALGVGDDLAHTPIRFGLGRFNPAEEVDYVVERGVRGVRRTKSPHIVQALPLPPVSIHCPVLAEGGIKAAIADWTKKREQRKPEAARAS